MNIRTFDEVIELITTAKNRIHLTFIFRDKLHGWRDDQGNVTDEIINMALHAKFDEFLYSEAKAYDKIWTKNQKRKEAIIQGDREESVESLVKLISDPVRVEKFLEEINADDDEQIPLDDSRTSRRTEVATRSRSKTRNPTRKKGNGYPHMGNDTVGFKEKGGWLEIQGDVVDDGLYWGNDYYHRYVTQPPEDKYEHGNWEADTAEHGFPSWFGLSEVCFNYECLYTNDRLYVTTKGRRDYALEEKQASSPFW